MGGGKAASRLTLAASCALVGGFAADYQINSGKAVIT
jgi:hypothetical protein